MYPADYRYTKEHEWVMIDGETAVVGITDHAQDQLGDVVFVELPAVGDALESAKSFGTVESVKAVSDLYAPLNGEVTDVNQALEDAPETVNSDPHGEGWMIRMKIGDPSQVKELMTAEQYEAYVSAETES